MQVCTDINGGIFYCVIIANLQQDSLQFAAVFSN